MSPVMASTLLRASRTVAQRNISTASRRANTATALPLSETVRSVVAEAAHSGVTVHASAEGFRAGVVFTLLAGSGAGAAWLIFGEGAAGKTVRQVELL